MLKTKTFKNTRIKALRFLTKSKFRRSKESLIQKICKKLSYLKIEFEFCGIFGYKSLVYEVAEWGFKKGFEYWWEEFFDKITFRNFRENIRESLKYFKQGWGSRNFDSAYALDDFIWKMKRTADSIEKYGNHVDSDKDVARIREAAVLLEKSSDDFAYTEEELKPLDEKWGYSVHYEASKHGLFNGDVPSLRDGNTRSFSKREKENDKNKNQIWKDTRAAHKRADDRRMADWKRALKLIEEHFFEWWD